MITSIITIGNSRGVRIPKVLLDESGLVDEVNLVVKKGEIRMTPVKRKKETTQDTLLLSEKSLGTDWSRIEEDEAWKNLQ